MSRVADDLSSNVRAFRELRGLTQADLARRAGMQAASISHFEPGQRLPSLDSLVRLADALEVSVDMLLGRMGRTDAPIDPVFLRASQSSTRTLDLLRRITEAVIEEDHGAAPGRRRK